MEAITMTETKQKTKPTKKAGKKDYIIMDKNTKAIVFGFQQRAIQRMLDFDYICRREEPSVVVIVNPTRDGMHKCFWGTKEILIPMVRTLKEASKMHPETDFMVNFASFRSAYPTSKEALETKTIRTVAIIAEGVPEQRTKELIKIANEKNKWIIGPATVGGIAAGGFRIGNTAGMLDNIVASKLHRQGSVAYVSKSGGLSNELNNIIAMNTDGVYEGVAIGGDRYPGSTFIQHMMRYEANPDIKMMVLLGEVGGTDEYEVVEAIKVFPAEVQFGHAGARAGADLETADAKNKALKEAGAYVPTSFDDFDDQIKKVYTKLVKSGKHKPIPDVEPPIIPLDYDVALKQGVIRRPANFISTISDDRGEELRYCGVKISRIFKDKWGLGGVIGLLWFKKDLPMWAREFIERVVLLTADHGPAVSGAHNSIIASRAGKDLISSLVSGLLTIGPRFGGAVQGSADHFTKYLYAGEEPSFMVKDMKSKNVNIQGIGHRIKSVTNPDVRVTIMVDFAKKNFPVTETLDYALQVEKLTSRKAHNSKKKQSNFKC
jgi:succinyl-CoA synthetase alpha subunit